MHQAQSTVTLELACWEARVPDARLACGPHAPPDTSPRRRSRFPAVARRPPQDRFLSCVKPVYYLRTRQYSRSVSQPPFIVNFQGCIFRAYPGHFQTLLDTGTGRYRKVVGSDIRPALGEFKEQLTDALREEGVIAKKEDEGKLFGFLRTGYKTTTWWEEEREEASVDWKT